ncbi:hypothetical protein [Lacticaseibacillus songhuajiangensis]|uniref:hypothetical protein n=1 Tax=Lacticaseibacillus songhuajiangensis TaxID=1296539 RepID=UPI000F79DEB1|nr:hypothetical protein [Lacticaseibacillus songhuajiangensis]
MKYVNTEVLSLNIDLTNAYDSDFLGERACRQYLAIDDLGWVTLREYGRVAADMPEYLEWLAVRQVPLAELPNLLASVRALAVDVPALAVGTVPDWHLMLREDDQTSFWQGCTAANNLAARALSVSLQHLLDLPNLWPLGDDAGNTPQLIAEPNLPDGATFAQYYLTAFMDSASDVPFLQANFAEKAKLAGLHTVATDEFESLYGTAWLSDPIALKKQISAITEATELGGAIVARHAAWLQGDHSALLAPEVRSWFMIALARLRELAAPAGSPGREHREFATLSYDARDSQLFLAPPNYADQQLTVDEAGLATFARYYYGDFNDRAQKQHRLLLAKQLCIAKPQQLFTAFKHLPNLAERPVSVQDSGDWTLTVASGDGTTRQTGHLSDVLPQAYLQFSQLLARAVATPEFMDLTGGARNWPDLQKAAGKQPEAITTFELTLQDATQTIKERLQLDAKAGTYEYQQKQGSRTVATKVSDGAEVMVLLQQIARYNLVVADGIASPDMTPREFMTNAGTYSLDVLYANGLEITTTAPYRRDGLPIAWDQVMYRIARFTAETGQGALLNPNRFLLGKRPGELIYLTVVFTKDGQEYNYQADEDVYQVGSRVLVPVGSENRQSVVTVTSVDYYMPGEEPYPAAKTKHVLRFADADDENQAEDD